MAAVEKKVNLFQKLSNIQGKLKAPKSQYNSFGKYSYRSAEDILEAVKPILAEEGVILYMEDSIESVGVQKNGQIETPYNYIKATAHFIDILSGEEINTSAYAKECQHTGMSADQCTGTASSYARKYCLNALFAIDDNKDSDSDEIVNIERANKEASEKKAAWGAAKSKATEKKEEAPAEKPEEKAEEVKEEPKEEVKEEPVKEEPKPEPKKTSGWGQKKAEPKAEEERAEEPKTEEKPAEDKKSAWTSGNWKGKTNLSEKESKVKGWGATKKKSE